MGDRRDPGGSFFVPPGQTAVRFREFLRHVSAEDWKTLSVLLSYAGEGEYVAVELAELARDLGLDPGRAADRLETLLELTWDGKPVLQPAQQGLPGSLVYRICLGQVVDGSAAATDLTPAFQYAESVLARPLSNAEILAIRQWHEEYGFETSVIVALLEDCYRRDQKHLSYLARVAATWYDQKVRTLADVERLELSHREQAGIARRIARYLGLSRQLTEAERALIRKWQDQWNFRLEVILQACATTVNINSPSFAYVDRVLENWHGAGVCTTADVERQLAADRPGPRKKRSRKQRAANFDVHYSGKDESFYEQFEENAAKDRADRKADPAAGATGRRAGSKGGKTV